MEQSEPRFGSEWPEITLDTWIIIPNWNEFQHYKHRDPPWIKVHTKLLSNPRFLRLSPASKGLLLCIWLGYVRTAGMLCYGDLRALFGRNRGIYPQLVSLNHAGFIEFSASTPLALRTELETEKETPYPLATEEDAERQLLRRAVDVAADWNGGPSYRFTEALDELEQRFHAHLPISQRERLWDEARKRDRKHG